MTIRHKSIIDGQKHANAIRNEQGRIRFERDFIRTEQRGLDALLDDIRGCAKCGGAFNGFVVNGLCFHCARDVEDAAGAAMAGDRWE